MVAPKGLQATVVIWMNGEREQENAADLVAGIILAALSAFVIIQAISMPRPRGWHSAPGLLPFLLGLTLLVMSVTLVIFGLRGGARLSLTVRVVRRGGQDSISQWLRALGILGGVGIYIYVLLRWFPFEVATFLYLLGVLGALLRRDPLKVILISAGVAVVLSLLFGKVLRTLLPGAGLLF
ncbi:MAG: tripartite tricarboxylate transporter TctB family protein [Armatimonadota bacterium]|nr:tripartite tricarboxylate transporter TctB family protein [Armatimonadota bacterium]MDR5702711.1 tripartite tricarboxylate transporter TctB family protein [Armatimonadota bacterium]